MAEYRTDLSRSIATVGKPDSPQGALKKAGLLGANPAAVEPMFNGPAIMEALGYNDPNGKIDIGVAGGDPGNRPPAIAGGDPVLAAVKAKDAAITAAPTRITPNAGITQSMVQKPVQAIAGPAGSKDRFVTSSGAASLVSTPKAIAGMTPDNLQTVGKMMDTGLSANGVRRMDAINQKAIAGIGTPGNGLLDDKGRTYDEQVAHAKQVNAANALPTLSPKQAAELAIANDPRHSRVTRANAAQGVAMFNNQMENAKTLLGNQQAQTIAGIKEQGDKYTADQHLAGVKYNADAHTKAAEIAGGAAVQKAKQDAQVKQQEQGQKDMKGVMDTYVKQWGSLNLPDSIRSNLHEFAKVHAYADANPDKVWIMNQSRDKQNAMIPRTINVGGKAVDTQAVFRQLETQFGTKEASSRVLGMVQQAGGNPINVPNWAAFPSMKQSENNVIPSIAG